MEICKLWIDAVISFSKNILFLKFDDLDFIVGH